MIYLDNAATTFPKPLNVYNEIYRFMVEKCANPGRGGHKLSIESGRAVADCRAQIGAFLNISDPIRLCFTKNATEALNAAIKGVLRPGDHAVISCMEHNSVYRPLKTLERDIGISLSVAGGDSFGEVDTESILKLIRPETRLVVCMLSSNVNGVVMPVREIGKELRERGVIFLLDASQGAGTIEVDVEKQCIDILAFPGHKDLLGPQGTGGLYIREGIVLKPLMEGGTGSKSEYKYQPEFLPDMFESGTLNTPGIVGLAEGVKFVESFGKDNYRKYKHEMTSLLYDGISEIKGAKIYSRRETGKNSGIIAMNLDGMDSTDLSYILDRDYDIATRAGLHCAPLAHNTLGTADTGLVRFSPGCFNTIEDIETTLDALREISTRNK